jgi:phosphohistidine phosphatase
MKTLLLIRHAKSDWGNALLDDFDRPLSNRGIKDASLMADVVGKLGIKPDFIITSTAKRARTTALFFAGHFNINEERIKSCSDIYDGSYRNYINTLNETDNKYDTVFLFGHNPEITLLASEFVPDFAEHVPTTGIIAIDFDIDNWLDIESGKGKLRFFEFPRKHK